MGFAGSSLLSVLVIASFVASQPPFRAPPGRGPPEGVRGSPPFGNGPPGNRPRPRPGAGGLPPFPGSFAPTGLPPFPGSSDSGDIPQGSGSTGGGEGRPLEPGSNGGGESRPQRPGSIGGGRGPPQRPGSNGGGEGRPERPGSNVGGEGRPQRPGSIGGRPQRPGNNGGGGGQSPSVIPSDELVSRALAQARENSCSPGGNSCNGNTCGENLDPVFHIEEDGEWRILITNGIPNHTYGVGAEKQNPNEVCVHNSYMKVPKNATLGSFQQSGMGPVGIALSGAFFYNHLSTPNGDVATEVEGPSFDSCSGHADPQCRYHYHLVPNCLDPDNTCKLVGYMMDGIPVYSYCTINGVRLRSCYKRVSGDGTNQSHYEYSPDGKCQLDEANGYDFGGSKGYGYVFSENYPFIMRGFQGSEVYSICSVE